MAVSQYLRPGGLLDSLKNCFTPDVVKGASSLVGAPESSSRQALNIAAPTMLGGLTDMASSNEGASTLVNMIHNGDYSSAVDDAGSLFAGGSKTSSMMSVGQQLVGRIFGNRSSAVAESVGRSSGLSTASATSLLHLVAPLAMGVVGQQVMSRGLNASGLSSLLQGQKDEFAAAMPSGMSRETGTRPVIAPMPSELTRRAEPSGGRSWLPLLLVGLAALLLFLFARSRMSRERVSEVATRTTGALSSITLPGGTNLSVPEGSINYNLARYLGDASAGTPRTFTFDHLNFESGTTQLTPESTPTLQNLTAIMKAYPNAKFQIAGYTDNTGPADANQKLSLDRADALKTMLTNSGINGDRISTAGYGEQNPVAPNDTDEGRARNRRTELTVTQK
jgi:OOP family OmpA-OmpF porin